MSRKKIHNLIGSRRILYDLKQVALDMEDDSRKYLEIRDNTKDNIRHEYWRAMAINNHETARMLMAFIDKYEIF
ncbi:MAG: hypothetical protein LUD72_14045 [Bacteroidales bacterium]|nr:hypothetical protein [Bacteroidales bacterium]